MTSALLGVFSIVTEMADLVTLTLREDAPCLGVIWCLAVPPLDLGVLQNSVGVSEVVGKSWGARLLDRHLLNVCGGHTMISTCDDMENLKVCTGGRKSRAEKTGMSVNAVGSKTLEESLLIYAPKKMPRTEL